MSFERRDVVLLGSTGSIGTQAIDVVQRNPELFRIVGLAAGGGQVRLLAEQAARLRVPVVALGDASKQAELEAALTEQAGSGHGIEILAGPDAAAQLAARPCDVVLNGITGAIGLAPTLAALGAGHTLALANKESLIIGGELVTAAAAPGQIVPVDSEHSALAQALRGGTAEEVRRLVLTASGGPFRGRTRDDLATVTPAEALKHPTWDMGLMVTTNSATLVNKGLEVIEAHLLFGIPFERIDVVVHPQSIVHSMVEFTDGSTLAQCSPPDMRLPIALGLGWPHRVPEAAPGLDWTKASTWEFFPLDDEAFPGVRLAREAGGRAGTFPAVYNAANEECVWAFHDGRIGFNQILEVVEAVLADHTEAGELSIEAVLAADAWARQQARKRIDL
ncbi:1-deoxy-D-xylulose 5-phosphate reductoisomerase [Kineosporia sp. NBRC 101677]|uniref:1-deoxy-D-xylulose-5-phosphate reductoisomerase n=1 Tax=Kineosporia sp. NBRC 101677 TaxID=3032197 RepID=UPI0024A3473E|nr:1-deoxy-D-xylulose-5-phosphate reductoisomerase [Kineosporia sp. NBRC 101677]GLY16234.1 1-deoxy-D-xylulose 5-phosphate reductoisomerase [Kineosporia sp. NBRC 101677]